MSQWEDIRRLARKHRTAVETRTQSISARDLLAAADELTGFKRIALPVDNQLLGGGDAVLDPNPHAPRIWFNGDLDPLLLHYYQAHEYAHLWIDGARSQCNASDLNPTMSEDRVPLGIQRVEGYGPRERRECQANVFAREFLLPRDLLRRWFLVERLDALTIASRVGVHEAIVFHQLAYALLTPPPLQVSVAQNIASTQDTDLDSSQLEAAHVLSDPLLIEAGPGTGKTRTLVGRIAFLLREKHVDPAAILALTFSNKAAGEMRERVAQSEPAAAPHIWMGTFHAFGLELLRKYGTQIDLPEKPKVLDPSESLLLLEQLLPNLRLRHYLNLYEPSLALRDILQAISRAKDELVTPERYAAAAEAMRTNAQADAAIVAAAKAGEVAHVYTLYQAYLEREGLLDFGDLISKAVYLLQSQPSVRDEVQRTYQHILVDEYQDVNRASGIFLCEIAGEGKGLWVVGDARQSIYRFRGAAPINMQLFTQEFPGADIKSLARNYRSQPKIVQSFEMLAPQMLASHGAPFEGWQRNRADAGGSVSFEIADDQIAEGEGLANTIKQLHASGIDYRDQAVLCRSHTNLARIAEILEREGVPILYLGDLFERPEIRDLLALISLTCEPHGSGLIRVARFPEYAIPLEDVLALLSLARERQIPFPNALGLADELTTISAQGKDSIARLRQHLDGFTYRTSAWSLLMQYLFVRSNYLQSILTDESMPIQQRRIAIYQFLQFAREQADAVPSTSEDPKWLFLATIRRLEIFGEERQLRQMPEVANQLDAVRLLTIHASKGLEFRAVFVPSLATSLFPANRQAQPCPLPDGLINYGIAHDHDEEEECLFFVALSRARDHLYLSRALRYGKVNRKPSEFFTRLSELLVNPLDGTVTWKMKQRPAVSAPLAPPTVDDSIVVEESALDTYMHCPRKYYYDHVLGLGGSRQKSGYLQFHGCVRQVLQWMRDSQASGHTIDAPATLIQLSEIWDSQGPKGHPHERFFRQQAEQMVARALQKLPATSAVAERKEYEIRLTNGRVRFVPDRVEKRADGTQVFKRVRTGRISANEKNDDIYGLYADVARNTPNASQTIDAISLSSDQDEQIILPAKTIKTRLEHYDEALLGIRMQDFTPDPSERECPRCPHYFICPIAEDHL